MKHNDQNFLGEYFASGGIVNLKAIKLSAALGVAALTIFSFQNCSQVNFAEDQPTTFKLGVASEDTLQENEGADLPAPDLALPDDEVSSDVVECELLSSKNKIVLDQHLKKGSNASSSRVCMSENACLKIVNSYASKRDCNLTVGESGLADSEGQCTKIFPGSKGTCRNAQIISDEEVSEILSKMEKSI